MAEMDDYERGNKKYEFLVYYETEEIVQKLK
jgi:hypothetical protein